MSADKRSTHTDALATLGTIIDETAKRDAIHLAVEPAVAGCELRRGSRIGFGSDGKAYPVSHITKHKTLGIVDPFIDDFVRAGERFWLIVMPRQITSLRHVWEHPEFAASELAGKPPDTVTAINPSEVWMRNYANTLPVRYDELLERAKDYLDSGDYWTEGGRFEGAWIPDEFWGHYETITGTKVPQEDRGSFFSCSC